MGLNRVRLLFGGIAVLGIAVGWSCRTGAPTGQQPIGPAASNYPSVNDGRAKGATGSGFLPEGAGGRGGTGAATASTPPTATPTATTSASSTDPCFGVSCSSGDGCCPFPCSRPRDTDCPVVPGLMRLNCDQLRGLFERKLREAQVCKVSADCAGTIRPRHCGAQVRVNTSTEASRRIATIQAYYFKRCLPTPPCTPVRVCGRGRQYGECENGYCILTCNPKPTLPTPAP